MRGRKESDRVEKDKREKLRHIEGKRKRRDIERKRKGRDMERKRKERDS